MKKRSLVGLVPLLFLVACDGEKPVNAESATAVVESLPSPVESDPTINMLLGTPVTRADFIEATKTGNLARARQDEAYSLFQERYRVAEYLINHHIAGNNETHIQVASVISKEVLDTYFDHFLENTITDEAVQTYFDEHPEEFVNTVLDVTVLRITSDTDSDSNLQSIELTDEQLNTLATSTETPLVETLESRSLEKRSTPPALWRHLLTLEKGDWSEPDISARSMTYHRIDAVESSSQNFDDVKEGIRYRLKQEAKRNEYERLVKRVNKT